jgi:hypothetical protein
MAGQTDENDELNGKSKAWTEELHSLHGLP